MSKGQRGNKEAKKPKKAPEPRAPVKSQGLTTATQVASSPQRLKR
jgi:hypothetical protein